ncbi:MAG: hypothetical protein C0399_04500 [Syntrophus sp. (in: bacteria)]|nr:hypothetical protein [Syntrophus sp. (in: bacteria)]
MSRAREVKEMKKDVTICFRTSEDLRASLDKVAAGERRSLSSIIETVLYDYLKEKKELRSLKSEKRIYGRREVSLPAFVYKRGLGESALQTGTILDLSLGGLRVSVPQEYDVQQEGEFDTIFTIPNEKMPVKMKCSVKGVLDGTDNTREILAAFVDGDFLGYQKLHGYLKN